MKREAEFEELLQNLHSFADAGILFSDSLLCILLSHDQTCCCLQAIVRIISKIADIFWKAPASCAPFFLKSNLVPKGWVDVLFIYSFIHSFIHSFIASIYQANHFLVQFQSGF